MRHLDEGDRPAIEAFLGARLETSMFPLANLARHGMDGGHRLAMRFWGAGEPLKAVLGVTETGIVLPQLDPALAPKASMALAGEHVIGIIGESAQVAALRGALRLRDVPAPLDRNETLLALDLAELRCPEAPGLSLAPLPKALRDLVVRWRAADGRETMGRDRDAEAQAESEVAAWLEAGQHRVLLRDGAPVAMTGFNARLPGIVQVGAVWTPPEHRRQGLARAAVALHLAEARAEGVSRAVLFTSNPFAERAYRALGFHEVGCFALLVFAEPQEVRLG